MLYSWRKPEKLDDGRRDNTLIKSRDIFVLSYLGKTVMSPILDRIVRTDCGARKRTSQLIQEGDKLKGAGQASW
ncbi:unnamed protein product [Brassica oleracea var. botrytis]|uniref:(rape) hypothetical protein n=2 Tax=Brassica TaxID=3705 RepID=A0A078I5X1_BRANA|nr:unnamed protein product [Brassica napus]CDY44839.1 BnaCnng11950D [Brassica napus]